MGAKYGPRSRPRELGSAARSEFTDAERARGAALLAHQLAAATAALGFRAEAFCLGPAARAVGRALSFVAPPAPPGGGPPPDATAALVLVDRAADPAAPALHADLLFARMLDALPAAAGAAAAGGGGGGALPAAAAAVPMPAELAGGGGDACELDLGNDDLGNRSRGGC